MSEYSTLKCDDCGLEITEGGWARVELPEGWSRHPYDVEDYCPSCTAENEKEQDAKCYRCNRPATGCVSVTTSAASSASSTMRPCCGEHQPYRISLTGHPAPQEGTR